MPIRELVETTTTTKSKSRGCPNCGSHDTIGLTNVGAQLCHVCNLKWMPCTAHCRGYEIEITGTVPKIKGCKGCGTPDSITIWWPEAWKAMAMKLIKDTDKMAPVAKNFSVRD